MLLASFVEEKRLDNFTYYLYKNYNIKRNDIFYFEIEPEQLLLTYKLFIPEGTDFNIRDLRKTIQIHKKENTFFTINALNKLIKSEYGLEDDNINFSKYTIEWSKFSNKIILIKEDELNILNITRKLDIYKENY